MKFLILCFVLILVFAVVIPAIDSFLDKAHREYVEREYARKTGVKLPEDTQ